MQGADSTPSPPLFLPIAGRRDRNRTCNRRIRNPMLYPFELRARIAVVKKHDVRVWRLLCPAQSQYRIAGRERGHAVASKNAA
jgi:hypothetical protein